MDEIRKMVVDMADELEVELTANEINDVVESWVDQEVLISLIKGVQKAQE